MSATNADLIELYHLINKYSDLDELKTRLIEELCPLMGWVPLNIDSDLDPIDDAGTYFGQEIRIWPGDKFFPNDKYWIVNDPARDGYVEAVGEDHAVVSFDPVDYDRVIVVYDGSSRLRLPTDDAAPVTVATSEELDALPAGSIIARPGDNGAYGKGNSGFWYDTRGMQQTPVKGLEYQVLRKGWGR